MKLQLAQIGVMAKDHEALLVRFAEFIGALKNMGIPSLMFEPADAWDKSRVKLSFLGKRYIFAHAPELATRPALSPRRSLNVGRRMCLQAAIAREENVSWAKTEPRSTRMAQSSHLRFRMDANIFSRIWCPARSNL